MVNNNNRILEDMAKRETPSTAGQRPQNKEDNFQEKRAGTGNYLGKYGKTVIKRGRKTKGVFTTVS